LPRFRSQRTDLCSRIAIIKDELKGFRFARTDIMNEGAAKARRKSGENGLRVGLRFGPFAMREISFGMRENGFGMRTSGFGMRQIAFGMRRAGSQPPMRSAYQIWQSVVPTLHPAVQEFPFWRSHPVPYN
jgi:hypothetical protein